GVCADFARGIAGIGAFQVEDVYTRAMSGQQTRGSEADSTRTAGDDGQFAFDPGIQIGHTLRTYHFLEGRLSGRSRQAGRKISVFSQSRSGILYENRPTRFLSQRRKDAKTQRRTHLWPGTLRFLCGFAPPRGSIRRKPSAIAAHLRHNLADAIFADPV